MPTYRGKTATRAGYTRPTTSYRSTSQVMATWGNGTRTPPPSGEQRAKLVPFRFWDGTKMPGGVHRDLVPAVQALNKTFARWEYRLDAQGDDWCYNRRSIRGSSTAWSSHSWGAALDINAATNPYSTKFRSDMDPAMVSEIEALRTVSGVPVWRWGGWFRRQTRNGWRGKWDAMHFQVACTPQELARGIVGHTTTPVPHPTTASASKDDLDVTTANAAQALIRPVIIAAYEEARGQGGYSQGEIDYWVGQVPGAFAQHGFTKTVEIIDGALRGGLGLEKGKQ